jgi:hypothetical protein
MVVINGMRTCGVNRTAALPPNSDYGSLSSEKQDVVTITRTVWPTGVRSSRSTNSTLIALFDSRGENVDSYEA